MDEQRLLHFLSELREADLPHLVCVQVAAKEAIVANYDFREAVLVSAMLEDPELVTLIEDALEGYYCERGH